MLDRFQLTSGGREVEVTTRGRRLVALLGLRGPQPRALVAGLLWPETEEHRARASLRAAVRDLQRDAPGLLDARVGELGLAAGTEVDVAQFREVAEALLRSEPPVPGAPVLPEAAAGGPLGGELLPGWYDDWALIESERLHQLRLHALEALAELLVDARRHSQAIQVALAAVALDPLRESSHRAVVRAHAAEGNAAEALRQYEQFRTALRDALGIEPSPRMLALVRQIRASGSPGAPRRALPAGAAPVAARAAR
jgi:DNA-binding SARP family transcriptional activator